MMTRRHLPALALLVLAGALLAAGCGEKIAIPEPVGLFSVAPYLVVPNFDGQDDDPRQLVTVQGNLFVVNRTSLAKRDQNYEEIARVDGFADPRAVCSDDGDSLVFVWDQGLGRVSWFLTRDLTVPSGSPGFGELPAVQNCVAMATSRAGVEQVPGALTYLYLADPDSGVVHRYAYDPFAGLIAHGILCRRDGDATRFVHIAAGMARDHDDSLLVCDRDTLRNWVIRFSAVPDLTDLDPEGNDPLRGRAAIFDVATCNPPAAADYVLGDAAACNESGWVGGPSAAEGEFDDPVAVTVDGSGRIYVGDTGNDRLQLFGPDGIYEVLYGTAEVLPSPVSIGVVDVRVGSGSERVHYGAFLFAIAGGEVRKFISGEHDSETDIGLPPPEE